MQVLELTLNRGMRLWLDGQIPTNKWCCGEMGDDEDNTIPLHGENTGIAGHPVKLGCYNVLGLHSDVHFDDLGDAGDPKTITLLCVGGYKKEFKVTDCLSGSEEGGDVPVKLHNGQTIDIDPYTLYIRATTDAVVGLP
jgi:hypothetical protein